MWIRIYVDNYFINNKRKMSSKKGGNMKYFSEDSAGFKIQPKTVLIMSLIYIGIVVLLHIYSKMGAAPPQNDIPTGPNDQANV